MEETIVKLTTKVDELAIKVDNLVDEVTLLKLNVSHLNEKIGYLANPIYWMIGLQFLFITLIIGYLLSSKRECNRNKRKVYKTRQYHNKHYHHKHSQ